MDTDNKKDQEEEIVLNSRDVIKVLDSLLEDKKYKKKKPYPKFTIKELQFLIDLIFFKGNNLIFIYLADYIINNTYLKELPFINGPNIKRMKFLWNVMSTTNATKAAIAAGYNPKCAKQQGYRIIKFFQRISNMNN